jgi:hypothetical protein
LDECVAILPYHMAAIEAALLFEMVARLLSVFVQALVEAIQAQPQRGLGPVIAQDARRFDQLACTQGHPAEVGKATARRRRWIHRWLDVHDPNSP